MSSKRKKRKEQSTAAGIPTPSESRKNVVDPSTETTETHLVLDSIIAKDDDPKRIDTAIQGVHADGAKKEEQPSVASLLSRSSSHDAPILTAEITNTASSQPQFRRTVTFDDEDGIHSPSSSSRPIRASHVSFHLSDIDSDPVNNQSETTLIANMSEPVRNTTVAQDLIDNNDDEDAYIPGGFINLDSELEEEFLNDFIDEFDDEMTRRNQRVPSIRSSDQIINTARSPLELWQRARILIAVHLYKIQHDKSKQHDNLFPMPMMMANMIDSVNRISSEEKPSEDTIELDQLSKLLEQKERMEERKVTFGLVPIQHLRLDASQQYLCADFYDVGHGYIFMCNVAVSTIANSSKSTGKKYDRSDQSDKARLTDVKIQRAYKTYQPISGSILSKISSNHEQSKLLIYPINKKTLMELNSVQFNCPVQFHFMFCIPLSRLIIGLVNIPKRKQALMILIGDASRRGALLSKQEISDHVYSVLYIHEAAILIIGCMGRVLLYNTQPVQFTSQPLFVCEIGMLPFQSMEPIIDLCRIIERRAVGLLSGRYFVLWQYAPIQNILIQLCNPHRIDFVRCHYNIRFDLIVFGFIDGLILLYNLNSMKQLRRYQSHWKMITGIQSNKQQNILISSSLDRTINVWNLDTLQHLYRYENNEEIIQIDVLADNLYFYRTSIDIVLFKLNLQTILFALTKAKVKSLKLMTETQRIARISALFDDSSSVLISPVSGCCLAHVPNVAKKPVKQILHDISRTSIYSLQFDGEIVLYRAHNTPCTAEYTIRTKTERYAITCMAQINPMRTHLMDITTRQTSTKKSLEKQVIFFGHTNGQISLFQGDSLTMEPVRAHNGPVLCLETSRASMEISSISLTSYEILLSAGDDTLIKLWDLTMNTLNDSIQLILIQIVEQEKNISTGLIRFLAMVDNFVVANYTNQNCLHIWQLLNIAVSIQDKDQWGTVEHPTKGSRHHGHVQAMTATPKMKLFASSSTDGVIKIWDHSNSLLREILLDTSLSGIEFLSIHGELLLAYQNNIHLILPENYLPTKMMYKLNQQQTMVENLAEDNRLEIRQPFLIPYESLLNFEYHIRTHHQRKRLARFERQLAGRFAVVESDDYESDESGTFIHDE